jgi:hypothetical protein
MGLFSAIAMLESLSKPVMEIQSASAQQHR